MRNQLIEDYLIDESVDIFKAHWMLYRNGRILVVLKDNRFVGVITFSDMKRTYSNPNLSIAEVCNKHCHYVEDGNDVYKNAKLIFSDYSNVKDIPVLTKDMGVSGLISREQVFWKQLYLQGNLPRMHYAYCIYNAAYEAKQLGYKRISVIEFGVAGGRGLICCEFHVQEIEKLFGIEIEIYGFDSAKGLPDSEPDYRNMVHVWPDSSFHMDIEKLRSRLGKSKLVIGRIEETIKTFFDDYEPAPIGCMFVDVDRYTSTVPILNMLESDNSFFMPRIHMYFDDLTPEYLFQGENLAIMEFNQRNSNYKISPEGLAEPGFKLKIKTCHRFNHKEYNRRIMLLDGLEITQEMLEAPIV